MSMILLVSTAIRYLAIAYSIFLLFRIRDWRIGFLTVMLMLMAFRQTLALYVSFDAWTLKLATGFTEFPGLLVSVMAFAVVHVAYKVVVEVDEREFRNESQRKAIVKLATHSALANGEVLESFQVVTETAADTLDVERVSVWVFNEDYTLLECKDLYLRSRDEHSLPGSLSAADFPRYFHAMSAQRVLDANDAASDPRTSEFAEIYLKPNGIVSMLDAPIRVHGQLYGVVCHEHLTRKRIWSDDEMAFAATVADQLAHTILNAEQRETQAHEAELEKQLMHSQRMESLGTFAGGIAHDFNNILQVILGQCDLLRQHRPSLPESALSGVSEIQVSGQRAAELVTQILTFSRKTDTSPRVLSLKPLLDEFMGFIRSSAPPRVAVELKIDLDDECVVADPIQLHQLFSNLGTNAIHAMEKSGGDLFVSVDSYELNQPARTVSGRIEPGSYVRIQFTDTGIGMEPAIVDHIWEPFFTTKNVGEGTGLGLAMVHGIMQDLSGGLFVRSKVNEGTIVTILLPVSEAVPEGDTNDAAEDTIENVGRILVVDDEQAVCDYISAILRGYGFEVGAFTDVDDCLHAVASKNDLYDVAVMDCSMPKMTGIELAAELGKYVPEMPIVMVSGLLDENSVLVKEIPSIRAVLHKPFRSKALLNHINQLMPEQRPNMAVNT